MKAQDQYLKFVRWEDEDSLYVGYCPDLFPWGGVCHGSTEEEAYRQLCALVAALALGGYNLLTRRVSGIEAEFREHPQ